MALWDIFGGTTPTSTPDPFVNMIDGVAQTPEWGTQPTQENWWDTAYAKQRELGLTPGMEGTTTLYEDTPSWSAGGAKPNFVSNPSNPNGKSLTFYAPPKNLFNEPLEGWDRFYNQALQGGIQEEYLNPAYTGQWGTDTSKFDAVQNLDPFKKDWNATNPYFYQKPKDNWYDIITDNLTTGGGLLLGGLGSVIGGPALAAAGAAGTGEAAAGATGLASLPQAGTWAQTALPALGEAAGQWTLPATLANAVTPLAGATQGLGQTLQEMFSNWGIGSDSAFNTPMTTNSGSIATEGAGSMFDDVFSIANEGPWGTAMQSIPESNLMPWEIGASNVGQFSTTPELWNSLSTLGSGALGAASDTGLLSKLFDFMKSPTGQLTKEGLGLASKFGSAAFSNSQAKKMQDQLVGQMNQYQQAADPFGPQRPYYQDELKKSYVDPTAIYGSDEYQSLKKIFEEGIRRRDAAQGRRNSNEFPRAIELQDHFMKYLGDYRKGLNAPAGVDINPNGLFGSMLNNFQQGQQQRLSALGSIPNAIGSMFDPYQNQKEQLSTRLASILEKFMNQ